MRRRLLARRRRRRWRRGRRRLHLLGALPILLRDPRFDFRARFGRRIFREEPTVEERGALAVAELPVRLSQVEEERGRRVLLIRLLVPADRLLEAPQVVRDGALVEELERLLLVGVRRDREKDGEDR